MPFRTALSGLNAATIDLKVTGNNIANSNTVGFKESRTEFVDVYAMAYGGIGSVTPGSGVRVSDITQNFSQGNLDYTSKNLDLGIAGQGFFVVEDESGVYYTRSGAFGVDKDGYVVNTTGQRLQVFPPTENGFNTGGLSDLRLEATTGAPAATTAIEVGLNLSATDQVPVTAVFDIGDPSSFNRATSITVYDSLGSPHTATMYYVKTGTPNEWETYLYIEGTEVPTTLGAGVPATMTFLPDGSLDSVTPPTGNPREVQYAPINLGTGALDLELAIDYSSATQYGSNFAVNTLSQDGYTTGRLSGFEVEAGGEVFARYTNGSSQVLGKVAMANFANPQGLSTVGDSLWAASFEAGDVVYGEAGSASMGLIQSGALEASNVDIAEQLVNLITAQRTYQANSQVISVADQLTQVLMNLRR